MKCENCCMGEDVHYVTLCGHMRRASVVECNDDDCGTVDLTVFTGCGDIVPSHGNEPTHPMAHVECVKHCPNGTPGTWRLPDVMPAP
jgi:hypothetical protein